ncbi:MAG: hypothetical protein CME65_02910 [Halobacteriovoraceae bacterium]|nr:hypothetical protein [Halobacteriovoraceae bacterium]
MNSQPWIENKYLDSLALFALPLISVLILFKGFKFDLASSLLSIFAVISFIDSGHLLGHWVRIFTNPLETNKSRTRYVLGFFIILFLVSILLMQKFPVMVIVLYLSIFHVARQQYGIIRLYTKKESELDIRLQYLNKIFMHLIMFYPILVWHTTDYHKLHIWKPDQLEIPGVDVLIPIFASLYFISALSYCYSEYQLTKKLGLFNIPKNMVVLANLLVWHYGILYQRHTELLLFGIVIQHGLSYFYIIWVTGRRDEAAMKNHQVFKKRWLPFRWTSYFGFFILFIGVNAISLSILSLVQWLLGGSHQQYFLIGDFIKNLPKFNIERNYFYYLIFSVPITFQIVHFIYDGFIWGRKKDYWNSINTKCDKHM